jgi:hypothetical protein
VDLINISCTFLGNSDFCHAEELSHPIIPYTSVPQPPGRGPVLGPGINYTGSLSYRKRNLPDRGLTKVANHCPTRPVLNGVTNYFHAKMFINCA